ncbi:family 4C encapsulin nanocompartment shell protein [Rhodothermus bifroesti]|jgi:hypothetical protein|uniref:Uncharacterized protein n=1 Tax=Rhodothermus marinus TaxID=29549 RepID=A0A7V2F5B8_RHOMR|nr:family 4C encapsulin nanocompartment shell protein [Rhodothermus bifroesti]GBD00781.1 hypothetical protein HRbin18_00497 [bacterium HR18]
MTILEYTPNDDEILPFIHDSFRQLQEAGYEPRYILVGQAAYRRLCKAIGRQFQRGAGQFETYLHVPIVVDPFRQEAVCVVPAAAICAAEASGYRIPSASK